ncbi:hypothetical protein ACFL6U_00525 [Planctomycetota bacterium]
MRGSTTASVYQDKLYIAGGIILGHWNGHVKYFDAYDFKKKTWEKLPDIPRFRDHAFSTVCDDKLYLIGGRKTYREIGKVLELWPTAPPLVWTMNPITALPPTSPCCAVQRPTMAVSNWPISWDGITIFALGVSILKSINP